MTGLRWESEEFDPKSLKDSYDFTCSECGHEQRATPSILMCSAINSGHGSCMQCKAFLRLHIDDDNDKMVASKWQPSVTEAATQ